MDGFLLILSIGVPAIWVAAWCAMPRRCLPASDIAENCGQCGYDMNGLSRDAVCPECGDKRQGKLRGQVGFIRALCYLGATVVGAFVFGAIVAIAGSEPSERLSDLLRVGTYYLATLVPWIVFVVSAWRVREHHAADVAVVGVATLVGMLVAILLTISEIDEEFGFIGPAFFAPVAGSLCALVAAAGCRFRKG